MKFFFAALVAILCVQINHGTPVNGGNVVVTRFETTDGGTGTTTTREGSFTDQWKLGDNEGAEFNFIKSGDGGGASWSSSSTTGGSPTIITSGDGEGAAFSFKKSFGGGDGGSWSSSSSTEGSPTIITSGDGEGAEFSFKKSVGGGGGGSWSSSTSTEGNSAVITNGGTHEIVNGESSTVVTSGGSTVVTDGSSTHDSGFTKKNFDFNISDLDLSKYNTEEYESKTTIFQEIRNEECERQRAKLNNDNDNLTRQLKSANTALATLTTEKSWVLGQLEECRDEYTCMSNQFEVLSTEITIWKKKHQTVYDDFTRVKTLLITANSEGLACKSKAESLLIEYNKVVQINIQNTITINEYKTSIFNLNRDIKNIKIELNNCGNVSGDWMKKFENESQNSANLQIKIKNLEKTIADLESRNENLNSDLTTCRNRHQEKDEEINKFKITVSDLKTQNNKLTNDYNTCSVSLQRVTEEYTEDEKQDYLDLARIDKLTGELKQCEKRSWDLKKDYESEISRGKELNNRIIVIRKECDDKYSQYDIKINELTVTWEGRINKCESDLTNERNTIVKLNFEITNTKNELISVTNKWKLVIQVSNEWETRHRNCENNSASLSKTIESLRETIETSGGHLKSCIENSNTIQGELQICQGQRSRCDSELDRSEKDVSSRDTTIVRLNGEIKDLYASKNRCTGDLSTLRCSINKFLPIIENTETNVLRAFKDISDIVVGAKDARDKFVDGHNIECPSCGNGAPCIKPLYTL